MAISLPLPVRVAAGLVATGWDTVRNLPSEVPALSVSIAGHAVRLSMRVQQEITQLAARGDELLAGITSHPSERPSWAHFDEEDGEQASPEGAADGDPGPAGTDPTPRADGGAGTGAGPTGTQSTTGTDGVPGGAAGTTGSADSADRAERAERADRAGAAGPLMAVAGVVGQEDMPLPPAPARFDDTEFDGDLDREFVGEVDGERTSERPVPKPDQQHVSGARPGPDPGRWPGAPAADSPPHLTVVPGGGSEIPGGGSDAIGDPAAGSEAGSEAGSDAIGDPAAESDRASAAGPAVLPGYDRMTLAQVRGRLRGLSTEEVADLLAYEQARAGRAPFLTLLTNRMATLEHGAP